MRLFRSLEFRSPAGVRRALAPGLALAVAVGTIAAAGCARQEPAQTPDEEPVAAALPDTTAGAVWAHLEQEGYRAWALWPGRGRLYPGTEPHGMLLTTHLNAAAFDAVSRGADRLPDGAIVVKENYMPDSTLAAVTVMYKRAGYDPAHNDWWWMKRLADGTVEASGRVEMCIACHGGNAANDYLMTAALR